MERREGEAEEAHSITSLLCVTQLATLAEGLGQFAAEEGLGQFSEEEFEEACHIVYTGIAGDCVAVLNAELHGVKYFKK